MKETILNKMFTRVQICNIPEAMYTESGTYFRSFSRSDGMHHGVVAKPRKKREQRRIEEEGRAQRRRREEHRRGGRGATREGREEKEQ